MSKTCELNVKQFMALAYGKILNRNQISVQQSQRYNINNLHHKDITDKGLNNNINQA